jgi:hypothetical protein
MAAIGMEEEIQALGKTWKLSRWDIEIWNQWLEWAKEKFPDPVATIRKELKAYTLEDQLLNRDLQRQVQKHQLEKDPAKKALLQAEIDNLADQLAANKTIEEMMMKEAIKEASNAISLASPKAFQLMGSGEGMSYMLMLLLKKYQPDVTLEDAMQIVAERGSNSINNSFDTAAGTPPLSKKKQDPEQDLPASATP